jgi:ELWxxDGT repeat protein
MMVLQVLAIILAMTLALYNHALIGQLPNEQPTSATLLVESEPFAPIPPCNQGGVRLFAGLDLNANSVLDTEETHSTTVLCNGPQGLSGPQGQPGTNGADAYAQVIESVSIPLGNSTCPNGGTALSSGLDLNGDGLLDVSEVTTTSAVCNGTIGANGANGADGSSGVDGNTGFSALVDKVPAPQYLCLDGFLVRFGVDNGNGEATANNGVLEEDEVEESLKFCFSPLRSERITDIFQNAGNSMTNGCEAAAWLELHEVLLFAANDGQNGCELHRVDGSSNTSSLVVDLHPNGDGLPGRDLGFIPLNEQGLVLFDANDGVNGRRLWVSDGTETGTRMLGTVELQAPVAWNEGLVFTSPTGTWLWTNGTDLRDWHQHPAWNTSQRSLAQAALASLSQPGATWMHGDEHALWFSAADENGDVEPYRLANDGSVGAWNINAIGSTQLGNAVSVGQDVVVVAQRGTAKQLLRLNTNGTFLWLTSIAPSSGDTQLGEGMGLHRIGDNLVYDAVVSSNEARLWTTNLANGITLQLSPELLAPGAQVGVANTGERLLFDCITATKGTEVCITDATPQGSRVLHDLTPGIFSSDIRGLMAIEDDWVVVSDGTVDGATVGMSLWVVEGEAMRLVMNPWQGSSNSSQALTYGNLVLGTTQVYFIANDGTTGHEWHRWSHGVLSEDWIVIARQAV